MDGKKARGRPRQMMLLFLIMDDDRWFWKGERRGSMAIGAVMLYI